MVHRLTAKVYGSIPSSLRPNPSVPVFPARSFGFRTRNQTRENFIRLEKTLSEINIWPVICSSVTAGLHLIESYKNRERSYRRVLEELIGGLPSDKQIKVKYK